MNAQPPAKQARMSKFATLLTSVAVLCLASTGLARLAAAAIASSHLPDNVSGGAHLGDAPSAPGPDIGPRLFIVNTTSDTVVVGACEALPGTVPGCSLRGAIEAANANIGHDVIEFDIPTTEPNCDAMTGQCTINLTQVLPDISAGLDIFNRPGANPLTVLRSSANQFRIFNVTATDTVSFTGITIFNGITSDGGGIRNRTGTVNITNCTITGNLANDGGGVYNQSGTVNVSNCTISNNLVDGSDFGGSGGGIHNANGNLTIANSTISHNRMESCGLDECVGAGISNRGGSMLIIESAISYNDTGAGIFSSTTGTVTISRSTINGNTAQFDRACGIEQIGGNLTVNESTINDNSGGATGSISIDSGTLTVSNSTISGNRSGITTGGSLSTANVTNSTITHNAGVGLSGTMNVKSTIVALNGDGQQADVTGTFTSAGFNLIGKTDGGTGFTASTDLTGTIASPLDPGLDPNGLRDNGGPTKTIALLCGSPAIDHGTRISLNGPLVGDQRSFPRTVDDPMVPNAVGGDGTDIGAFEAQSCSSGPTPTPTATATSTPTPTPSPCPLSPGYWKNHPNAWPVTSLTLGSATYTQAQLLTILNSPSRGDASVIVASQLIAALLNIAHGSDPAPIASTVAHAQTLLTGCIIPCGVKPASAQGQLMTADAALLDRYNNGLLTPDCAL